MTNTHICDLRDTLSHARLCHEGWWLFKCEHPRRDEIVAAYNQHSDFFSTVQPALFVTFVIKLASVFGKRSDEISLKSIPCADRLPGFSDLWSRGQRFHKYRSKIVAHRDINIATNTFIPESGCPTFDSLKSLLDDTCQFFNDAAKSLNVDGLHPVTLEKDFFSMVSKLTQDTTN